MARNQIAARIRSSSPSRAGASDGVTVDTSSSRAARSLTRDGRWVGTSAEGWEGTLSTFTTSF